MSNPVHLSSVAGPWRRLFDTNILAAAAAFTANGLAGKLITNEFIDVLTTGLKYLDLRSGNENAPTPNAIQLRFFGTDTNNQTIKARVWGISRGIGIVGTTKTQSWEVALLAEYLATISDAAVGVAGTIMAATDLQADTISLVQGATQDSVICSPANELRGAWVRLDIQGHDQLVIELEDGTAAAVNALYRFLW